MKNLCAALHCTVLCLWWICRCVGAMQQGDLKLGFCCYNSMTGKHSWPPCWLFEGWPMSLSLRCWPNPLECLMTQKKMVLLTLSSSKMSMDWCHLRSNPKWVGSQICHHHLWRLNIISRNGCSLQNNWVSRLNKYCRVGSHICIHTICKVLCLMAVCQQKAFSNTCASRTVSRVCWPTQRSETQSNTHYHSFHFRRLYNVAPSGWCNY